MANKLLNRFQARTLDTFVVFAVVTATAAPPYFILVDLTPCGNIQHLQSVA